MAQSASLLLLGLAGRRNSRNHYLAHTRITSLSFKHKHTQQRALSNSHSINDEDPILPVLIQFVLQILFYPPQQRLEDFSSEMHKIIYDLVGKELADIKVIDIKPWVMHVEVAEKFLSCGNRIILAGDVAHHFPPAGGCEGFGLLKLALFNLAQIIIVKIPFFWTESAVGQIATFNTILSVQNFKAAIRVPVALGLDPTIANAVHQVLNNTVGSILPSGVQKTILDGIFSIGRAHLSDLVLNPNNPLGSARLARLREIFEEGQSLQLQFPAEDLGFRYLKGALVSDGDNLLHEPEAPTGRRRDFVPSADPGSRLPHINIRPFSNPPSKETFSTLDLVSAEKLEFLLIIAPVDSSYHLALATFQVAEECKVPLKVCVMWPGETNAGANRSKAALLPWENFVDVLEVKRPPNSSSWWGACQMTDRGAILVRPDEHIAWRTKSELAGDATTEMRKVFRKMDGLAEEILSSQPPVEFWRKFIYCTSLTGLILGSVDHMQHEDFDHIVSPVSVAHFSQYKLTRFMLKQLKELDFHIRNYEGFGMNDGFISEKQLLMGHECTAINPSNHFITVTTSFPWGGKSSEKSIRCQFLVGTDGVASTVRKLYGNKYERREKNFTKTYQCPLYEPRTGAISH
nr:putative polyketide hydroxylase isoform X2 [Ipomoea batatas]